MLGQLIAIVLRILGITSTVLTIEQEIQNILGAPAQEATLTDVAGLVADVLTELNDATNGLAAIKTQLALDQAGLLLVIGTPQQTGVAVTLPATPPAGYGGASTSDIATAVWNFDVGDGNQVGLDVLEMRQWVYNAGQFMDIPKPDNYPFVLQSNWANTAIVAYRKPVQLDVGTILASDATVHDWVTRVYPAVTWLVDGNGFTNAADLNHPQSDWQIPMTDAQFTELKIALGLELSGQLRLPPIWPGLANVVFASGVFTTVPIAIDGPMHGAVVAIVSMPATPAQFDFGGQISFRHVGAVSFENDDGDAETFVITGFTDQLVMPQQMTVAQRILVSIQPGWQLQIAPFTIIS